MRDNTVPLRPLLELPLALGRPLLKAGAPLVQPLLLAVLRRALNDSGLAAETELLAGRCLAVEVTDLGIRWRFTAGPSGLAAAPPGMPADATISGSSGAFLLLASRQEDPDTLFFRRRLGISGDTALGLAVKNLLDALEPDALPAPLRRALADAARLHRRLGSASAAPSMPGAPLQ